MRLVWQARPSYSLSRPPSIGNWRRQTTPSSGISITLIGISIGINTSVGIGEKWKNSPREICPSASVRMRGRDILPPSFHNHTDHWGNQQRSAKISGKSDQIRSTSSDVLQQTDLADLSLASSSCWVFCSEPESRSAPSRAPIPVEPEDAQHPPANSSSDKILRQNAGPVPGQSSIMGRVGGGGTKIVVKYDGWITTGLQTRGEMKWSFGWKMKLHTICTYTLAWNSHKMTSTENTRRQKEKNWKDEAVRSKITVDKLRCIQLKFWKYGFLWEFLCNFFSCGDCTGRLSVLTANWISSEAPNHCSVINQ